MKDTVESTGVETKQSHGNEGGLLSPDVTMILLTWIVFFALLGILTKFAWNPILEALDEREETIRQSLEEAEKAHQEFIKIDETRKQIITQAETEAKDIIDHSRKAALNAAKIIEQKAREEAQIILENTERELKLELQKANATLRQESADVAIQLASKIIEENLDNTKSRKLVNKLIKSL